MSLQSIQDLIDYRRSKETPEERAERLRKTQERLAATDRRIAAQLKAEEVTEELLNRRCTL
ncbi:hypothetical protein ST201phi2-1p449 [Pseudomonas phage 201phi2-1]|uniref:Uncharacterized protein n=1 Tax=Pseudomonas phage 201phi2-1 TaxID=198110 RepID=B3FJV7_BP201|nr:hypothetical protein ST201phi2-1p449 [Pseudomonas phage 201phi2-1]ABY63272.1 hypothetical protein 201phi2-1p449 [Pseudomonas phage 201phi2-1]